MENGWFHKEQMLTSHFYIARESHSFRIDLRTFLARTEHVCALFSTFHWIFTVVKKLSVKTRTTETSW
jgi:hypothetical protein